MCVCVFFFFRRFLPLCICIISNYYYYFFLLLTIIINSNQAKYWILSEREREGEGCTKAGAYYADKVYMEYMNWSVEKRARVIELKIYNVVLSGEFNYYYNFKLPVAWLLFFFLSFFVLLFSQRNSIKKIKSIVPRK